MSDESPPRAPRRPRFFLIDLLMVVLLSGLAFAAARLVGGVFAQVRGLSPLDYDFFLTFLALELAFIAWAIAWQAIRRRRRATECSECGRRFVPPPKPAGPAVCPRCRQRALGPDGIRAEQARGLRTILALLAIITVFMGFFLSKFVAARFAGSYWLALPLIAAGATLGLLAALILAGIAFLLARERWNRSERHALARARKVAGEEGEQVSLGPLQLWYSGPTDPAPMLREQGEAVRGRFAAMIDEPVEVRGPLPIFCFHQRDALVAFHRQTLTNLWDLDGLYTPGAARGLTMTIEVARHRPADPAATARSLFALTFLEEARCLSIPWLHQGINHALIAADDIGLDRLNRKMVVSLARGAALGEELFRLKPGAFSKLLRGRHVHGDFARLTQFAYQSWSLVEYLGGPEAPKERGERFRNYLRAIRRGEPGEAAFRAHIDGDPGRLLEAWRAWVLERGIGAHAPPDPLARDALLERVIPTVRDRTARIADRILAVRGMGGSGYPLGADALIDLLRDGGGIAREEVVWSLEAISGFPWGDDLDRWTTWWDSLPRDVREGPTPIPSPTAGDA